MPAPPGFGDLLARKYDLMQDTTTSEAGLRSAQGQGILGALPSENAVRQAQAGATSAQGATYGPLAAASIASTQAGIPEQQARARYFNTQADVQGLGLQPYPDLVLGTLHDQHAAFGGGSAFGPQPGTDPLNQYGVQQHAKGTANVKKTSSKHASAGPARGRGAMAAPAPQASPQPLTSMPGGPMGAMPGVAPPQGLPGLAAMLHAAAGCDYVYGPGDPRMGPGYAEGTVAVPPARGVPPIAAPVAYPTPPGTPAGGFGTRRSMAGTVGGYAEGAARIPRGPDQPIGSGSWTGPTQGPTPPSPLPPAPTTGTGLRQQLGLGRINAAGGATRIPGPPPPQGQGNTDTVPAMLTPGEAVVNREGVKHIPGGRAGVAQANAKGLQDRRQGLRRGMVKKGTNHVAIHVKMA